MWLPNVLLTSRYTCMMSLEETRASSFISFGKTGEEEQASGTQTPTCHELLCWAGSLGPPWECVLPKPLSFLWEARHGESVHRARDTCVRTCAQLLWAGR